MMSDFGEAYLNNGTDSGIPSSIFEDAYRGKKISDDKWLDGCLLHGAGNYYIIPVPVIDSFILSKGNQLLLDMNEYEIKEFTLSRSMNNGYVICEDTLFAGDICKTAKGDIVLICHANNPEEGFYYEKYKRYEPGTFRVLQSPLACSELNDYELPVRSNRQ